MNCRRDFLKKAAMGAVITACIPDIVSAAIKSERSLKITLSKDSTILFQGDSITDSGRNKTSKNFNDNSALGNGYVLSAASELLYQHPDKTFKIYNRGISGNKVFQLAERWDADCIDLKPDVLSILIGVNDFWHMITGKYDGNLKTYRDDFRNLLDKTKEKLPDVKLIIGEPFAVNNIKAVDDKWFPQFYDYQKTAREIADNYEALFVPYQAVFDKAQKNAPGVYWTADGVHPTVAGARLMAQAWLETVRA